MRIRELSSGAVAKLEVNWIRRLGQIHHGDALCARFQGAGRRSRMRGGVGVHTVNVGVLNQKDTRTVDFHRAFRGPGREEAD